MEIKMGDRIITLVEKHTYWDNDDFIVPKGTDGLVCETYEDGTILVEIAETDTTPFTLEEYKEGEYEKIIVN